MAVFTVGIATLIILAPWLILGWILGLLEDGGDGEFFDTSISRSIEEDTRRKHDEMFYVGYINERRRRK